MPSAIPADPTPDALFELRKVAFGLALRQLRLDKGFTQEQLAWATGISPIFISNLERGYKEPCLNTIATLCESLKIPVGDLMLIYDALLRKLQQQGPKS